MYKPTTVNRTITLFGHIFEVYSIKDFKFNEGLDVTTEKGLYCFSRIIARDVEGDYKKSTVNIHELLYLGMTQEDDGIKGRLDSEHDVFKRLKQNENNCVSIHVCGKDVNIKALESEILNGYFFSENTQENEDIGNRYTTVREDS